MTVFGLTRDLRNPTTFAFVDLGRSPTARACP
jgi:hypothetical protein